MRNQKQLMKGGFPADILSGTEIFFVNCNIIKQQQSIVAKAPILHVIDTGSKPTDGMLKITSCTAQIMFAKLQFKKPMLNSVREVYVELVTTTENYVPFVGTRRVFLTIMFTKN